MISELIVLFNLILINIVAAGTPQGRIVGGSDTDIEDIPWQVSLQFKDSLDSHFCGGAVISEKIVLTAAHCCEALQTLVDDVRVRSGSSNRKNGGQLSRVDRVIPHPLYKDSTVNYDVCVLQLIDEIKIQKYARLPRMNEEIPAGKNVLISGWGFLSESGTVLPTQLQSVTVKSIDDDKCKEIYGSKFTRNMWCAGETGKDACTNDSGGPAMIGDTLYGIVSFGKGCGRYPTVYAKVPALLSWIQNNLY